MLKSLNLTKLCIGLCVISLFLSLWNILTNPVLSNDSILYLRTAQAFHDSGFAAALNLYHWPLLSVLISWLHSLSGLSMEHAAHLLGIGFYMLLLCAFVAIIAELGGSIRTQLIAGFLVLAFPTLNDYRDFIIRDHAYWALVMLSLHQLLRFNQCASWRNALGWGVALIIAIGFRIEGVLILALAPFSLLFVPEQSKAKLFRSAVQLFSIGVVAFLMMLVFAWLSLDSFADTRIYKELGNIFQYIGKIDQGIDQSVTAIKAALDNPYFNYDAKLVFVSGLLALMVFQGIHAFTPVYLLLLVWGRNFDRSSLAKAQPIIIGYLVLIGLYLLVCVLTRQFMNDRFMVPFCLVLLIYLPFAVERLWVTLNKPLLHWKSAVLFLLLLYSPLDTLISTGTGKGHVVAAAHWLNNNIDPERALLTNNEYVAYVHGRPFDECSFNQAPVTMLQSGSCASPEFLVIELKRSNDALRQGLEQLTMIFGYRLLQKMQNKKHDEMLIYERVR